ncbi:MAG: helix-turn-helix transcriptional regulator [Myxococcota bacterium]|jgi:transcriptional regulator with XRE-family HTH domain|nr:helix-turn-helix transcriptional regulator [Myxococcota bacterium]
MIVHARERKGLSVNKTALQLAITGSALSRLERGLAYPGAELLQRMADFYALPLLELQAAESADRGRIELPEGTTAEDVRAAVFRLHAGHEPSSPPPDAEPVDPHGFACPHCGKRCVAGKG